MERVYIVGGRQRPDARNRPEWRRFERAVILELDWRDGRARTCVEYQTPADAAPDEGASSVFKAATLDGDRMWVPTQTEILCFRLPAFEPVARISLPFFNDLHHVRPTPRGTLLVAVTGLDLVAEITPAGDVLREWDAGGGEPWARFERGRDYRRVPTTKPHQSHPNYVFEVGEDVWTTRFEQGDAVCLTGPGRIALGATGPHDGVVHGGRVHFTSVEGAVICADPATGEVLRRVDVTALDGRAPGWCRGLDVVDGARVLVAFSRLRPTAISRNVEWVARRLGRRGTRPTQVGLYDLAAGTCEGQHGLQRAGIDAVFSVHAYPAGSGSGVR